MSKKEIVGRCRICGLEKKLSYEHILPRIAGGDKKVKLYQASDVLEADEKGIHNPFGKIYQMGYGKYTLCKECNEYCGSYYDKDFAKFYRTLWYAVSKFVTNEYTDKSQEEVGYILRNCSFTTTLLNMKPLNIAKRLLAAFCSIEDGTFITDEFPEIRKGVLNKDYRLKQCDFRLYFCLHLGGDAFYSTIAAISHNMEIFSFAGMEVNPVAFYFTQRDAKMPPVCVVDITHWLTDFEYDEKKNLYCVIPFNDSLGLRFPSEIIDKLT